MTKELYKKYRPKTFKEVIGQDHIIKSLNDMGKRGAIPHYILLSGGSGIGKTTIARILRIKLKCSDHDFQEINAAKERGIDMVRSIASRINLAPIGGSSRVWLIDESHALTSDAQSAFLKMLEDTPSHVYFILATTNPEKLKPTMITRATHLKCKPLNELDLCTLINIVLEKENKTVKANVVQKIAEVSEGSARKALVILHSVIGLEDEDEQLKAIEDVDIKKQAIEICRALFKGVKWEIMSSILKAVDEEPESIRWMILGYCRSILLKGGDQSNRAAMIIEEFRENFYDSKGAGLAVSCWNVLKS